MTFRAEIQFQSWGPWHWPILTHKLFPLLGLANSLAIAWFWSAPPINYQTQESRWPSCESIVLILGANLQATALPEAYGVIRTSTVVVTYLVTNSVWREARWEMEEGRRGLLVGHWDVSPQTPSIWLRRTDKRSVMAQYGGCMYSGSQKEEKWTRDTAANRAILYRAICIYRATVSVLPCKSL